MSRTATAPLEALRLSAMAGGLPPGGRLDAMAAGIVRQHGWRALYQGAPPRAGSRAVYLCGAARRPRRRLERPWQTRPAPAGAGNAVNVMRSAPQKALDFFTFDLYKRLLAGGGLGAAAGSAPPRDAGLRQTFLAAGLAGATSCLLLYPLEVARMRMTLDRARRYAGPALCLRALAAAEGPGALLRGLGPSLLAVFPEAAITYVRARARFAPPRAAWEARFFAT